MDRKAIKPLEEGLNHSSLLVIYKTIIAVRQPKMMYSRMIRLFTKYFPLQPLNIGEPEHHCVSQRSRIPKLEYIENKLQSSSTKWQITLKVYDKLDRKIY